LDWVESGLEEIAMLSPFPGLNPYLEARTLWRGFHTQLIVEIARDLQPQLVPRYVARTEERVVLAPLDQSFDPDVQNREPRPEPEGAAAVAVASGPGVVVPERIAVPGLTIPHRFVAIRDRQNREVVTVIEVLSPWNKVGEGRQEYREKQAAFLLSDANLVEIDLLRRGPHAIAVPEALTQPSDYRICIHRARRDLFELIWFGVRDPLPNVPIPLRSTDTDVTLHLGEVFNRCFEGGAYSWEIDYSEDPDPPLSADDAAWARERISEERRPG
jgi:hypothetical protein